MCDSDGYCDDYDVLDAIEQSVADGVDVISMAISDYEYSPWYSSVSQALLGARGAGIFVAAALQDYDDAGSPGNAPWLLGVAATSHDRRLTSALSSLSGGTNPPADFPAQSLTSSYGPAAIVSAGSFGSSYCGSPFPAGTFNGQIVVCEYSPWDSELAIGQNVLAGGAGGLVLATYHGTPSAQQAPNVLPAVLLSAAQGDQLLSWLSSGGGGRTARITGTTAQSVPSLADRLWSGSPPGYGYYSDLFDFLKPDVAAPGQEILAAHIDPSGYKVLSGTSMAAAHAAGAAALLTALHPGWTPAEIQSALQTTAVGVTLQDGTPASPIQTGAGRVDLGAAARAGLVLDATPASFSAVNPHQGGDPGTLNLAGLARERCVLSCGWTRTVRSTKGVSTQWSVSVEAPAGIGLTVQPASFTLAPGATQTLQITATGSTSVSGWKYGRVILTETGAQAPPARLPLATWWAPHYALTIQKEGLGSGRVTSNPVGIDCGADCFEVYPENSDVVLTATPDPGSVFVGWGGSCYGVSSTCDLDMYGPRAAIAYFSPPSPDRQLDNQMPAKGVVNGPVSGGSWNYYFFDVGAGTGELIVDLFDLDGDADLFLQAGSKPDLQSYTCRAYDYYGQLNRRCVITQPASGRWWVGVNNVDEEVDIHYSIRASWGSSFDRELANRSPWDDFLNPAARGGSWKYYFVDVEPGSANLQVVLANLSADADLYLRHGSKPDRSNHSCASIQASTLPDVCNVTAPASGRWWIGINNFSVETINYTLRAGWRTTDVATDLYTVPPCRLFDSRSGQPLSSGGIRNIPVTGACGIPPTARAVSLTVTVVGPTGIGRVVLFPGGEGQPSTSTLNFQAGQNKANNALLKLGGGALTAWAAVQGEGQVHLILDVNGYFAETP